MSCWDTFFAAVMYLTDLHSVVLLPWHHHSSGQLGWHSHFCDRMPQQHMLGRCCIGSSSLQISSTAQLQRLSAQLRYVCGRTMLYTITLLLLCSTCGTDLRITIISQPQAPAADVSHCWSTDDPHNLSCTAPVITHRQYMRHTLRQLAQRACSSGDAMVLKWCWQDTSARQLKFRAAGTGLACYLSLLKAAVLCYFCSLQNDVSITVNPRSNPVWCLAPTDHLLRC